MPSYDVYARFYDATQGDRDEHAAYVRSLIERHNPGAHTVLELACGTGSVLERLRPRYEVTGVDLSQQMLDIAARRLPGVPLHRADMTAVDLGETFDVVLCIYDSINHLTAFGLWEAVFDRARAHLEEGGVFIFDVNTERKLARFAGQPAWPHWFADGNLCLIDVRDEGAGLFVWNLRVFEHLGASRYVLHEEDIREAAFPVDRITASLRTRYRRVRVVDAERSRPTTRSERLHFVCHG